MLAEAQKRDVAALAKLLLDAYTGVGDLEDLGAFAPDDWRTYHADLYIETDDVQVLTSALSLLVLALNAGAVIVDYFDDYGNEFGGEVDVEMLLDLAGRELVEITFDEVGAGSFRMRFKIDPRSYHGRRRVACIGVLAGIALIPFWGQALILGATAAVAANEILTPDDRTELETVQVDALHGVPAQFALDDQPDV